jgi:putative Mn2+ efflux pump MntP
LEAKMGKLNLNFIQPTERYEPTKSEIAEIVGLALSVDALAKALEVYAIDSNENIDSVSIGVCNAIQLLINPVIVYLCNYAGDEPAPEKVEA